MTRVLEQIKTRGYWHVRVHPVDFQPRRFPDIARLKEIIRDLAVETGNISLPIVAGTLAVGSDWTGQEIEDGDLHQSWRFYQSGQLVLFEGFVDDWQDESFFGPDEGWTMGAQLSVSDVLTTYWQVFEFAARFAASQPDAGSMTVSVHAFGLKNRQLLYRFRNRARLHGSYAAIVSEYATVRTIARDDLVALGIDRAAECARELFARFQWDVEPAFLRTLMREGGLGT